MKQRRGEESGHRLSGLDWWLVVVQALLHGDWGVIFRSSDRVRWA